MNFRLIVTHNDKKKKKKKKEKNAMLRKWTEFSALLIGLFKYLKCLFINASDKRFAEAARKRRGVFESRCPESQN